MHRALPIALALAVLSLDFAPPAHAVPLTVNFTVQGAWNDAVYGTQTGSGSFTFDSSIMSIVFYPPGKNISALSLHWAGSTWTTANADADYLIPDSTGSLENWRIGGDIHGIDTVSGSNFDFLLQRSGYFWYSYGDGEV